jgi:dihydroorotase
VVDLPTTMTKFLALGLTLDAVVAAVTVNSARAVGWEDRIGRLEVGREADVTLLELREEPTRLLDSVGEEVTGDRRIVPRWTIRAGQVFAAGGGGGEERLEPGP